MLQGVPDILRPALQDETASILLKTKTSIAADLSSFQRNQHMARTTTAVDLYKVEAENHAKAGDAEAATDAQFKALQLTSSLEASGLLSPTSAEVQRRNITRDTEDQIIYGAFERDLEKGKGLHFITRFNNLKSLGDRDPVYRKQMSDTMLGAMSKRQALDVAQNKAEESERKERWRIGENQIVSLDLKGELSIDLLQTMIDEDKLDPGVAAKYKKNAMSEAPEFSDGSMRNAIRADVLAFTEFEILTHSDLSMADREIFINEHRRLTEDAGNWRSTQSGSEGARRINQAFGIIAGVDTRITEEKAKRAGNVLTRYFNEVEALPIEEREAKTTEIADRLVKEVNGEIIATDLEKARERLLDSPYQTEEQIKAAGLGSEEEKIQIIQLDRKLKKIERLERQNAK